tara:strand:- start:134 stop:379 length:246 start_codon:yes stop_codon:yes gene_type:complete
MPTDYGGSSAPAAKQKMKKQNKIKKTGTLTEKQKEDLKKHMDNHKDLKDMTPSQLKSHRMKMMVRMKKGMSISAAHKDIGK